MQNRRISTALLSGVGIFLLIMDGKTAIQGISEGIDICIRSVIPSLFPFVVLGCLLTGSLSGSKIPLLYPLGKLFRIPTGAESLLLIGFLGGYPVGAQSIAQAYRSGQLSKQAAERMLAFCNQAGPSFLFGILGPILSPGKAGILWGIQIISALLVSLCIPAAPEKTVIQQKDPVDLSTALNQGIRTMSTICGWIILFRMIIAFLHRWILWLFPAHWNVGIIGMLELANGCLALPQISNESIQFLICAGILSFGGICVTMQTASVIDNLSLLIYFPGKIMQALISMLISWIFFPTKVLFPVIFVPMTVLCIIFLRKMENRSGNLLPVGV